MSRHIFEQKNGGTLAIGWDAPLDTFYLQIDCDRETLTVWEGTAHGEYPDPAPLIVLAWEYGNQLPADLAETLWAEKAAKPGWRPWQERIADGSLMASLSIGEEPPCHSRRRPRSSVWGGVS